MDDQLSLEGAQRLDAADELKDFRKEFLFPPAPTGSGREQSLYFCGNSLGLQPVRTRARVSYELDEWARRGVSGHHHGSDPRVQPWLTTDENVVPLMEEVVGAAAGGGEVAVMNGLTANLHLMMVAFYVPKGRRRLVMIEARAFPSDSYAVRSQIAQRGLDPDECLIELAPREGEACLRAEDILARIESESDALALVLLSGVQYLTGQLFDLPRITEAAQRVGAFCGWDLAHAAGNVPLRLHDWGVDFACWCSYKYLNAGPGGIAGAFVHQRHGNGADRPRFAGWWGHEAATRFDMDRPFAPERGAFGYRLSNPPVLQVAALHAALEVLHEAGGIERTRQKSLRLTAFLEALLLAELDAERLQIVTPRDPTQRGCQLSLRIRGMDAELLNRQLEGEGVICDVRKPDTIRVAPAPLYNSFEDCYHFVQILKKMISF